MRLQPRRFIVEEVAGGPINVGGFVAIDESKLGALSDAQVLELHKTGLLGMIHAHHLSLHHMWRLVKWHAQRHA